MPSPPLSAPAIKPVHSHSHETKILFSLRITINLYSYNVLRQNRYVTVDDISRNKLTSVSSCVTKLLVGLDMRKVRLPSNGNRSMYSRKQFAALELMCRERAALAKKEMEYSLAEYWLAEAEEWKDLRDLSDPFIEVTANRSSDPANSNSA